MNNNKNAYLPTLTPLRGIAAVFVVLHHSTVFFGPFIPSSTTRFFENSWIWVDFFFILSGFILTYRYGSFFQKKVTLSDYKKYIGARFARIYPLHFFTLLGSFAIAAFIAAKSTRIDPAIADLFNLKAIIPSLFLVQDFNLYRLSPLNFPSWSLSAEWWVYMVFPLLVPFFTNLGAAKKILGILLVAAAYVALRYILGPVSGAVPDGKPKINIVADFGVLRCFTGFCAGMLLFAIYRNGWGYKYFKESWCFVLVLIMAIAGIHAGLTDIAVIAVFPLILLSAAYNDSGIMRVMSRAGWQRLGDWSFSIYMVHAPIILLLLAYSVYRDPNLFANVSLEAGTEDPDYKASLMFCAIVIVSTLVLAALTYRFIERPGRRYLNNIIKGKKVEVEPGPVM